MTRSGWVPHLVLLALLGAAAMLFATYANPMLGMYLTDWMIC